MFESKVGYFSENGKEYVITDPHTPTLWQNRITNGNYGIVCFQNGNGYSWMKDSRFWGVTKPIPGCSMSTIGKFFYLRDRNTDHIWTLTNQPVADPGSTIEVHQGIGYTVYVLQNSEIRSELKCFVSSADPVEIMEIKITNRSSSVKDLDLTSFLEWETHQPPDSAFEEAKWFQKNRFDPAVKAIKHTEIIRMAFDNGDSPKEDYSELTFFHAVSETVRTYETNMKAFVGPYGSLMDPLFLRSANKPSGNEYEDFPIASLKCYLSLNPSESKTVVFTVGAVRSPLFDERKQTDTIDPINRWIEQYTSEAGAKKAFLSVQAFWDERIKGDELHSPDWGFDLLVNQQMKYQSATEMMFASDGDSRSETHPLITNALIDLESNPERAKEYLIEWAKNPVSEEALWFPYVLDLYIEETFDFPILNVKIGRSKTESISIYEVAKNQIRGQMKSFPEKSVSSGNSVFHAGLFLMVIQRFIRISRRVQDSDLIREMNRFAEEVKTWLNEIAWDGEWLRSGILKNGKKIGSFENENGKMTLLANIFGILSDSLSIERQNQIVSAIDRFLVHHRSLRSLSPAFSKPDPDVGLYTFYPPGVKENGGIDSFVSLWAVRAFLKLGRKDFAWQIIENLSPIFQIRNIDSYQMEPYFLIDSIDGPDSIESGKGRQSFSAHSAQWFHRIAVTDLIGVKATDDGLQVNPQVPASWNDFTYRRKFRTCVYEFTFTRGKKTSMIVDGSRESGGVVPDFQDGGIHQIHVTFIG